MHELAIADSVVQEICERVGAARVTRVVLEIGALSCVEPAAIQFCFEVCARGTCAEGAKLELQEVRGRARCSGCGAQLEVAGPAASCQCGSLDLEVIAGEQLLLKAVEIVECARPADAQT